MSHACFTSTDENRVEIEDGNHRCEPPTHKQQTSVHEKHALATNSKGEKPTTTTTPKAWGSSLFQKAPPLPITHVEAWGDQNVACMLHFDR